MAQWGELNLGQLARERFGDDVCAVGFPTYAGTVTAAHDRDEPAGRREVIPALDGSVEAVFHETGIPAFLLDLHDTAVASAPAVQRLPRAIGVISRPESERQNHYLAVEVARQFDLVIHLDRTTELKPFERTRGWDAAESEVPETYPSSRHPVVPSFCHSVIPPLKTG